MSNKHHRRLYTQDSSFLTTIRPGFNYFNDIDISNSSPRRFRTRTKSNSKGFQSFTSFDTRQKSISEQLQDNKKTYSKIKTEFSQLREIQLKDYIKKSMKYQEILNLNDNKKKRLPTLNAKIGQIVKKSVVQNTTKSVQYYLSTSEHPLQAWRPQSREGHTTTVYKNTAVVIGGHCSAPFSVAQVYSFESHSWVRQMQVSSARSYHSAVFYKGRFIIIFGGMGTYDVSRKCRVCFNTINLIDLQTWSSRALKMGNEQSLQGRRSHGTILMGKYMLVFGGMNTKRQYLKQLVYLDLKELKWYHKQYKVETKQLNDYLMTGLARHKMIPHFKATHKNLPLYSSEYTDEEGAYIFGGNFGDGNDNIVTMLGFNKYNPYFRRVEYRGSPPPSSDPLVEKVSENLVMIIGGQISDRKVKLFQIRQKQFVSLFIDVSSPFLGGIGSSLTRHNEDLYLFFGLSSSGYINTVASLSIEEKVSEGEAKKKKVRQVEMDWHMHKDLDSDSQIS